MSIYKLSDIPSDKSEIKALFEIEKFNWFQGIYFVSSRTLTIIIEHRGHDDKIRYVSDEHLARVAQPSHDDLSCWELGGRQLK